MIKQATFQWFYKYVNQFTYIHALQTQRFFFYLAGLISLEDKTKWVQRICV